MARLMTAAISISTIDDTCIAKRSITSMARKAQAMIVSGIGFYRYSGAWLNPHKAYLEIDVFKQFNSSTADENDMLSKSFAKGIRFVFAPEEETTGLPLLDCNIMLDYKTDAIYDLSGRRVVTPHRGHVYITNGTKVLKK